MVIAYDNMKAHKQMMKATGQTYDKKMFSSIYSSKMSAMGMTGGISKYTAGPDHEVDEEEARLAARKIGPFSFDIDDDIDTEILTNEQVYDDLKELQDILEDGNDSGAASANVNMGKSKRKRR
jgi:hypothetical protein